MTEKRFATRYLLPLEMAVALQLLVIAAAGSWPDSALHNVLALTAENGLWTVGIGMIGLVGLCLSAWEWMCGVRWVNGQLRRVLWGRKWVSAMAVFAWSYALYTMLKAPEGWRMVEIVLESVPFAGFSIWSWWVNYRTECVLDPTMQTSRLERDLEAKRGSW